MARGFAKPGVGPCPCGSGSKLSQCCGPMHSGERRASTAEQLMRSRYSAYALSELDYLIATNPDDTKLLSQRRRSVRDSCRQTHWHGLTVLGTEAGSRTDLEGTVCFEAIFSAGGERHVLRENALFRRRDGTPDGEWLYVGPLD